ncbi:MAG: TetR/AcrR family transcriptional regulator [Candidatus Protistobacter heckmanni]|nr:TetR/AcrR family transcriptional regulator [Candidatus Protistobacter heckmanni]
MTQGPEASARILDAAEELFYREGARMVGVDAVVKKAGVNKMSLYRQFSSKDELLRQYLLRREDKFWSYVNASLDSHPEDPRAAVESLFLNLSRRTGAPGYRGCPFVNVAAEYPDPAHFARQSIARHKHELLERLHALSAAVLARAGAPADRAAGRSLQLAKSLAILIEGAYTASQTYSAKDALLEALPAAAGAMIDAALQAA